MVPSSMAEWGGKLSLSGRAGIRLVRWSAAWFPDQGLAGREGGGTGVSATASGLPIILVRRWIGRTGVKAR